MKRFIYIIFLMGLPLLLFPLCLKAQNLPSFGGELSAWGNYNSENGFPLWLGSRYIPKLNYNINLTEDRLIDFEASANIYGTAGIHLFDTAHTEGSIKPYRAWMRYSTNQFELRLGLQKINFGSAMLLRPLMWFDRVDPRDPLQLTDGVWGLLGRYYFLNNTNLWLWVLYGNNNPKAWETGQINKKYPEAGGRVQMPLLSGEAAVSYHFRMTEGSAAENRIGLDGKWDLGIGLWFEGAWINKNRDFGILTNQEILNAGTDYTFGIGNGLNLTVEQLLVSYDKQAFTFTNTAALSALSVSYPLGIIDNVNAIVYRDWKNSSFYNFINWKRQFDNVSFYIMAYWNPADYQIPQQTTGSSGNIFSGKGIQLMLVYNH